MFESFNAIFNSLLGQNITTSLKLFEPIASLVKSTMRNRRSVRALTSTCQRTNLYVDFTKIGWSGWIISPRGYNAYSCTGSCPFPLGEGLRATNHATVRSIMNALKLSQEAGSPAVCQMRFTPSVSCTLTTRKMLF